MILKIYKFKMTSRGMLKKRLEKRGLSPVIATVLLVAMVIVIALIIFLWFRSLSGEAITKFGGTNIKLVCKDVSFSSDYTGGSISISNFGNVPIYSMEIKISSQGSHETQSLSDLSSNWPTSGLRQGGVFSSQDLSSTLSGATEVKLIPVLAGTSDKGQKTYTCEEQYGEVLNL